MEKDKFGRIVNFDQLTATKEEPNNPLIKEGVINNKYSFIPASFTGDRIDSLTDLEENFLRDFTNDEDNGK